MTNRNSHSFADQTMTLEPGENRRIPIYATFVRIVEASAPFKLQLNDTQRLGADIGFYWKTEPGQIFTTLTVINGSGTTSLDIRIVYGTGDQGNDSLQLNGSIDAKAVQPSDANYGKVTINAGSFGKILDANSQRYSVTLRNPDEKAVWIRTTTGGGTTGLYLDGTERVTLELTSEIWVSAPLSTNAVDIEYFEEIV